MEEMKPGLELDKKIYEFVMGGRERLQDALDQKDYESERGGISCPPEYSTDIAAAWEVLERIQKQGYPLAPFRNLWKDDADLSKMPYEICLAALKAVGG